MRPRQALGRPGTAVIPQGWSQAPRVIVEKTMGARCRIRRPVGQHGEFNRTTGSYPDAAPSAPHYDGPCRVQILTGDRQERASAEEDVTVIRYLVVVDLSAGTADTPLSIDDLVEIYAVDPNGDPGMVGRVFTVDGVQRGSLAWERDLTCVDQLRGNEQPV